MRILTLALLIMLTTSSCAAQTTSETATNRDGSLALFKNKKESNAIYVTKSGNMGIGKKKPTDKLEVNGRIHARSVKVDLNEWADTVFEDGYDLARLREIENYINTNGHLPEIPSTEEVLKNGIELGEMNRLLLKKVEELTLHLIRQEKQIEQALDKVATLEKEIGTIKKS